MLIVVVVAFLVAAGYTIIFCCPNKSNNKAEVKLISSEDGISPGQACVFYDKDIHGTKVLGGGWITG